MPRRAIPVAILLCSVALPARAAVWYVSGSAAADGASWATSFPTIQQGVDAAQPGDEVWVAATKSYAESVVLSRPGVAVYGGFRGGERRRDERLSTDRSGVLPSSNTGPVFWIQKSATGAILDGLGIAGATGRPGVRIEADNVTLTRNAIHDNNAGWQSGGGIYCDGNNVLIADNLITNNAAAAGGGMVVASDNGRIERNIVRNNTADNMGRSAAYTGIGGGMYLRGADMQVRNNVVAWNTAIRYFAAPAAGSVAEGGGVYAGGRVFFVNNTLAHNAAIGTEGARGGGFALDYGIFVLANNVSYRDGVRVTSETAAATGGGYAFPNGSPDKVTFRNNYFYDDSPDAGVPDGTDTLFGYFPQFVSETDFHLTTGSPLIDIGSNADLTPEDRDADGGPRVMGQRVDIGAYEFGTPTAAPTLTRAYVRPDGDDRNDAASWETARRSVGSALSVTKPGGEVWVAAGTYTERVTLKAGMALLGGFAGAETEVSRRNPRAHPTILDGDRKGSVVTIPPDAAGAVLDGFTVRHGSGAGRWGEPSLGGGILSLAPNVVIANNIVEQNHLYGGGSENWPAGTGGGAYVGGSGAVVSANIFRDNQVETYGFGTAYAAFASSSGGGLSLSADFAVIVNNLFAGNSALAGGRFMAGMAGNAGLAVALQGGVIAGNTIAGNTALPGYDGTFSEEQLRYSSPRIVNNIIAFDTGTGLTGYGLPHFSDNLVYGNTHSFPAPSVGQNGNIAADPLFANMPGGDYHLQPGSPAIDAGDSGAAFSALDLEGNPRLQGGAVDIGAYEWAPNGAATAGDAAAALRIAAGLSTAAPALMPRLNVDGAGIDLLDAVRLLRAATH